MADGTARRTIGDFLLAQGFVSEEALATAAAEQERTAQPLGQILVQNGVITRLELASALAEQWSDPSASITTLTRAAPVSASPGASLPHDDAQYAARLQDAVADLARRVQVHQPVEGADEQIADLSRRIEATLARTQRIEATMGALAESLEGITGGVEEAFAALQTGTAELARELGRIDETVAQFAAPKTEPDPDPSPDPVLLGQIEELREAVNALAQRPVSDEDARARVEEIASRLESSRLETMVDGAALDDLRGALRELEGRPVGDPELAARLDRVEAGAATAARREELETQAAMLADLRAALAELDARPIGNPDLDARLEQIESHLAATADRDDLSATVAALGGRVDEAVGVQGGLVASIDALGKRLDEVSGAHDLHAELAARLDRIEDRLVVEAQALGTLREAITAPPDPAEAARIDELSLALEAVRSDIGSLAAAAGPDPELAGRLEALVARVEQLAAERADQATLTAKVEAVEQRLDSDLVTDVVTPAVLAEALAEAAERTRVAIAAAAPEPDGRLDQLVARVEHLAAGHADQATLTAKVEAITAARASDLDTIDVLARAMDRLRDELADGALASLEERLRTVEAIGTRVDERVAPGGEPRPAAAHGNSNAELEEELERFRMSIERLGLHLGEHDRALADLMRSRGVVERLDELSARIEEVAAMGPVVVGGDGAPAVDVSADMRALMLRVGEAESASQADRERLMSRLERMASSIDWRLQRLETDDEKAGD